MAGPTTGETQAQDDNDVACDEEQPQVEVVDEGAANQDKIVETGGANADNDVTPSDSDDLHLYKGENRTFASSFALERRDPCPSQLLAPSWQLEGILLWPRILPLKIE